MSDSIAERGMTKLDLRRLDRAAALKKMAMTVEALSVFIAPAHIDIGQRKHIEHSLLRLVDLILIEAEARAVARLGGAQ